MTSTSLNPKITIHPKTKNAEELIVMSPIDAYKAGYFDAIESVFNAESRFVTTLKVTGWDEKDILKALLCAIRNYSEGNGVEETEKDVIRTYSGKGANKNGQQSKTRKL